MNKMNNKGQSLVTFVLVIPIAVLIFMMIYDIGSMVLLKSELNNINYLAIDYGLSNINEEDVNEKIKSLIVKNKSKIDNISINIEDDKIYIILEDSIDTKISLKGLFKVKSSYVGYLENDKKKIERNK